MSCDTRGGYGACVRTLAAVALAAFFSGLGLPAAAQELVVVQGLAFGPLLPGVTETVAASDVWRRAEVRVEGTGSVEIRILAPDVLREGAAGVPFRLGEAALAIGNAAPTPFDTSFPLRVTIPPESGFITLYFGGIAAATDQRAGPYAAPLSILVMALED